MFDKKLKRNINDVARGIRNLKKLGLQVRVIRTETMFGAERDHVYVVDKEVFAQKPDNWDTTSATKGGQKGEMRVLGELSEEDGALLVPKEFSDYVEINPNVMDGEPVVKDTRVPTSMCM